jgi:hypothetical protein
MLTEEEARKKICPQMTYCANESGVVSDGHSAIYYQSNCVASKCMAWRAGVFAHQRNLPERDRTPEVGYCGAFGKPKCV